MIEEPSTDFIDKCAVPMFPGPGTGSYGPVETYFLFYIIRVTLTVPFEITHNELKSHRVDCANSSGKMLYQANKPSRDGQLEDHFGHSNPYEQYFNNLRGRQTP